MNTIEYLTMQAAALPAAVHRRLDELTDEQFVWRPEARSNHVAFIAWHCLRACDWQLGRVRGVTPDNEVWQEAGFRERTGYDPRGLGTRGIGIGTGFTLEMVDAVPYSKQLVFDYVDAVAEAYKQQLATMQESDLERDTADATPERSNRAVDSLEVALRQFYQHMGECDFLRGLIGIPDPTMPRVE